jgi:hypothetical protein
MKMRMEIDNSGAPSLSIASLWESWLVLCCKDFLSPLERNSFLPEVLLLQQYMISEK